MKNVLFYLTTVLIWGSTWIGIKMQLGVVDPMVSVTYRFGLASLLLLIYCIVAGLRMRFSKEEHMFMFFQGILLFGFNYLLFILPSYPLQAVLQLSFFQQYWL